MSNDPVITLLEEMLAELDAELKACEVCKEADDTCQHPEQNQESVLVA